MKNTDFPIFIYDLETTSADPDTAKIVSMSVRIQNFNAFRRLTGTLALDYIFNPGVPISPDATAVHGITDADVASKQPFFKVAYEISHQLNTEGMILCGYNNRLFDDIILERELADAGHPVDLFSMPCIDLFALWRVGEPRTLTGAMKRFLGRDMENAHDAAADTDAVVDLIPKMVGAFGLPDDPTQINATLFPEQANWVDRQGKIVRNDDGEPCLSFGKHKGTPLGRMDRGYLQWMLGQQFPADTKAILAAYIK